MLIDVALIPAQRHNVSRSVCIVVDVLRASSSIVALLERGAGAVLPAASIAQAREIAQGQPGVLLCGEEDNLPPPGFDYGNSPVQFSRLSLHGRLVILATSNGTRLLSQIAGAPAVLVGCLLNRSPAASKALALAQDQGLGLTIVCAGAHGGRVFALEDALGAGAIVDAARRRHRAAKLMDGAQAALAAFRVHRRRLSEAVASTTHARDLIDLGLGEDVAFCARLDACGVVPRLERVGTELRLVALGRDSKYAVHPEPVEG